MKKILTLTLILISSVFASAQDAEDVPNPLDFWKGKWMLKNTSIDPPPVNDEWESAIGIHEFISTMDGKGLHRVVKAEGQINETYFFWDEKTNKVYTFSIDPEGYLWETSANIREENTRTIYVGGAKNDPSLSTQLIIEVINKNEARIDQTILKAGKKISQYKGVLYRMPSE